MNYTPDGFAGAKEAWWIEANSTVKVANGWGKKFPDGTILVSWLSGGALRDLTRYRKALIAPHNLHTGLLDHLRVDYYGSEMPINQVANVTLADARTIAVQPFEKKMVQVVEKAIRDSDLGVNPATSGDVIRIPMPALTEERRKELTKHVHHEGENAKVAIRNVRRDAIQHVKEQLKDMAKDPGLKKLEQAARTGRGHRTVAGIRQRRQPEFDPHLVGGIAQVRRGIDQRAVEIEQHAVDVVKRAHAASRRQCIR